MSLRAPMALARRSRGLLGGLRESAASRRYSSLPKVGAPLAPRAVRAVSARFLSEAADGPSGLQLEIPMADLTVGVPTEIRRGRVGLSPENVAQLLKKGVGTVVVQKGAGADSGFTDAMYADAGAKIVDDVWGSDIVFKLHPPSAEEAAKLGDRTLISQVLANKNPDLVDQLAAQKATVFDMTMLSRTLSRGQAFDTLSSQANLAGYRATIEGIHALRRPMAGMMTSAGRVKPSKVLVLGVGVAGLQAIQVAKGMGAQVYAFDVRAVTAEQVESLGGKFLHVDFEEDGAGAGGYAKEMSPEWFAAARAMLEKELGDTDVAITTALVPGRPAPELLTQPMVQAMPSGSVVVDMAAEAGGNYKGTRAGESFVTENGVTVIGYTDLADRLSPVASSLYGNNLTKFFASMETSDGTYGVDFDDEAVRSTSLLLRGERTPPFVPPPPPPPPPQAQAEEEAPPPDPKALAWSGATRATLSLSGASLVAAGVPNAAMLNIFVLSNIIGQRVVEGVTHALHSPLMSVTNAISGMTVVGGLYQMGGGLFPSTSTELFGATAVLLSAVNISGGSIVTHKMLDMFRRPDDPPEYNEYYLLPAAAIGSGYLATKMAGSSALDGVMPVLSGLGCIGGINALSSQSTARMGNVIGLSGISFGLLGTFCTAGFDAATAAQAIALLGAGGAAGAAIAQRVGPTELPQTVAAFHSLVGLAACATAAGDFAHHAHELSSLDAFHQCAIFGGMAIGAVTATGSVIAFAKLNGNMGSAPVTLPNKDMLNVGMGAATLAAGAGFLGTGSPGLAAGLLATGGFLVPGALGLHMTASIGGADMPVVITLLNSYSGWALCSEGFMMDKPLLTVVGALIGSSGWMLTTVMCEGMNRDLFSVISGGFGAEAGAAPSGDGEVLPHTEVNVEELAERLKAAEKVVIVPGYGLAVANAQADVAEVTRRLKEKHGVDVTFGVHPVAGRMPGQLNVLLAEAGVPYDVVFELEEINEQLEEADMALVIGANDTVNSAAEDDPASAIAGMPVIQVWKAKNSIVFKRSMGSGYAGVQNPVFFKDNNDMMLGDAKDTCSKLASLL